MPFKAVSRRVRLMIGCASSAPRALGIRTATMAPAENATCHLAKGEGFKARSEKREPPTKSTKESATVPALEKELEQLRQATKKSEESSQQETDASKAAYNMAIKPFGQLQTAGLFLDDHPAIKTLKAELDQAKAASDESVPLSKTIRAGQNQIAMHERDLTAANE